jgi:hypothetical protein
MTILSTSYYTIEEHMVYTSDSLSNYINDASILTISAVTDIISPLELCTYNILTIISNTTDIQFDYEIASGRIYYELPQIDTEDVCSDTIWVYQLNCLLPVDLCGSKYPNFATYT